MVSWALSFVIGFGVVAIFGLGYFLGDRVNRITLKQKDVYISLAESSLGKLRELSDLQDVRIEQLENELGASKNELDALKNELEALKMVQNECVEADKKAASDIFRTPKGLLSFKKYVRE